MSARFTIDGSHQLENRLEGICDQVRRGVTALVPRQEITAIVLGGGYGRGEGGVLKAEDGDQPYNDMDFYVFTKDRRPWRELRYSRMLHVLGEHLSAETGLQIDFKIECAERWKDNPPSMFSYDLASGHRVIFGEESVFHGCEHHLQASAIPLAEATRLMFNRCSGLLLTRELLQKGDLQPEEKDFVGRNLAKMQLAMGDSVLTAFGHYHWSAPERHRRLSAFSTPDSLAWGHQVRTHHEAGVAFKLHPRRASRTVAEFDLEHRQLTTLSLQLWLWLEGRRLQKPFLSASDYALCEVDKCPGTHAWKNYLLSLRTFGPKASMESMSWRYPRGRLFNALALLLWQAEALAEPHVLRRVQQDLQTDAFDWTGLVKVFKGIWPRYG